MRARIKAARADKSDGRMWDSREKRYCGLLRKVCLSLHLFLDSVSSSRKQFADLIFMRINRNSADSKPLLRL